MFNMLDYAHAVCGIKPVETCEICGEELTDENRSEKYDQGCKGCDDIPNELPRVYDDRDMDDNKYL